MANTIEIPVEVWNAANAVCISRQRNKSDSTDEMLLEKIVSDILPAYKKISKDVEASERNRYFQNVADGFKPEFTIEVHLENRLKNVRDNIFVMEQLQESWKAKRAAKRY